MLDDIIEKFLKSLDAPNKQEQIDFLEFVTRKLKDGDDFKKIVMGYAKNKKNRMAKVAESILKDIDKGDAPADALKKAGLLNDMGYSVLTITNLNKGLAFVTNNISSSNEINKTILAAMWKPIGTYFLIALSIVFGHGFITSLFSTIDTVNKSVNKNSASTSIPYYLDNQWFLTEIGLGVILVVVFFGFIYKATYDKDASIIYRLKVFQHKVYEDLHITLQQYLLLLESGVSNVQVYKMLAEYGVNSYFKNLFNESLANSSRGGALFEVIKTSEMPNEIKDILYDGEVSQQEAVYIKKAINECEVNIKFFVEVYSVWAPFLLSVIVFSGIGFLSVHFFAEVFKQSLAPILSGAG